MSVRSARMREREYLAMSWPSNMTEPAVGSSSFATTRAVVDLPHPDSPTRPSVSPGATENETPSTARTAPVCRWITMPWRIGKCFLRSLTASRASGRAAAGCTPSASASVRAVVLIRRFS